MPESLSPEPPDEVAPLRSARLSDIYESPDRTIQEVGSRASAPDERSQQGFGHDRTRPQHGPVTEVVIDPLARRRAKELAVGDLARFVLWADGTVYAANSAHHARSIRKDSTFGITGP
jgi:hypothetical protein